MKNNYKTIKLLALGLLATVTGVNAQVTNNPTVQIIHNIAAPAAALVDVYVNNNIVLDNVPFRTASPFLPLLPATPYKVTITASTSTSSTQGILLEETLPELTVGQSYIVVASGVPTSTVAAPFAPNPNPLISTALDLIIKPNAKQTSTVSTNVDIAVVHGVTDAPGVDVVATLSGGSTSTRIVNNAAYSAITDYTAVPVGNYTLNVKDSVNTSTVSYKSFTANLATLNLGGKAIVVLASGFLTPATNSNGPAFGLFVALPAGGALVELPAVVTSTSRYTSFDGVSVFPVPSNDKVYVNLGNATGVASLEVFDITGRTVQTINNVNLSNQIELNVADLNQGEYFVKIVGENNVSVVKCAVVK